MDNGENLAEYYFSMLNETPIPAATLAKMLWSLVDWNGGQKDIIMLKRLIKIYGRNNIYFSILDLAEVETLTGSPFRLLVWFAKKRLEGKFSEPQNYIDAKAIEKKLNKKRRIKPKEID